MNQMSNINKLADRKVNKARKREGKKREIAESAINALKLFGYAHTTLRDIAAQANMSLGSLHYYFEDKDQLLIYCVRQYKHNFVQVVQDAVKGVADPEEIAQTFCQTLAETINEEAELHRLWYDIRNQAMFNETFLSVVEEIEAQLIEMMRPFSNDRREREIIYIRFDGAFRYLLQKNLSGYRVSVEEMRSLVYVVGSGADFF